MDSPLDAPERPAAEHEPIGAGSWLGDCHIEHLIGEGGSAAVYRAYCHRLDRPLAIKVLAASLAEQPTWLRRFRREARIAARVIHPHLVRTYDLREDQGHVFILMEYLSGGTVEELLRRSDTLAIEHVLRYLLQASRGLAAAHAAGIVHRDIKPSNLMLDRDGGLVIADFGLAHWAAAAKEITQPGEVLGTPAYLSPEQALDQPIDGRSDLYSLGVCAYRMLTGVNPFEDPQPVRAMLRAIHLEPEPPHHVRQGLPLGLSQLVMRLIAKDPAERPAAAEELAELLTELAAERARRSAEPGQRGPPTRTRPTLERLRSTARRPRVLIGRIRAHRPAVHPLAVAVWVVLVLAAAVLVVLHG